MSDKYIIQKNVPIPTRQVPNSLTGVLRRMEVGDCVDVPITSNVYHYAKRAGKKVVCRRIKDGEVEFYRLWVVDPEGPKNGGF